MNNFQIKVNFLEHFEQIFGHAVLVIKTTFKIVDFDEIVFDLYMILSKNTPSQVRYIFSAFNKQANPQLRSHP